MKVYYYEKYSLGNGQWARGRIACVCILGKAWTVLSVEVLFALSSLLAPTQDLGKRPFGPIVTPLAGVGDPHCPFRSK